MAVVPPPPLSAEARGATPSPEAEAVAATGDRSAAAEGPSPVVLHMPVDVRSASLAALAVVATIFTLHWAAAVFIPVMLGVILSYALAPVVDALERWRLPRGLSAVLILCGIVGSMGAAVYWLSDDAADLIDAMPKAAEKLRRAVQAGGEGGGAIAKMQEAAAQLEQAATTQRPLARDADGVTRVRIEPAKFDIKAYLWSGTIGLIAFLGQFVVVCFITCFLLASGDRFRRKLVHIVGQRFSEKRVTVQALDEITAQIQRYLIVQIATSVLVGFLTWAGFVWIGLDYAAVWGVAGGVLNMVPYVGPIAVTAAAVMFGFLQVGTIEIALLIVGVSVVIHVVCGYWLQPWLTSRAARMSPVVVFVGVLAWGWLWGIWGLLLGIPILMIVKAVCDRVDNLKPLGELLGE